ncbi:hypothetical protein K7X08_000264 [Anisodus acutangulus]|uniref:Kinesin-like protein n=1 Tax=Anisodus acutangulus TaxID=402998 RepID=A0A9Q1M718_9SOLA|nr:hypothetical protein K7X08_000264 [Anisodus acutangulus]
MNSILDRVSKDYGRRNSSSVYNSGDIFEPSSSSNAKQRAKLVEWLNSVLPHLSLPINASDEDLRAFLVDGSVLCQLLNKLKPGSVPECGGTLHSSEQRAENIKRFLYAMDEMGLPRFQPSDLEQGSMKIVLQCLLTLHAEFMLNDGGHNSSKSGADASRRWKLLGENFGCGDVSYIEEFSITRSSPSPGERQKTGLDSKFKRALRSPVMPEPSAALIHHVGHKFHEVFQLKHGSHTEIPAAKISKMMISNTLDISPTQSLLSVVNGMLDESVERKNGEIPQQNNLFKTCEEKYQSRIRVLEALATGTSEETQIVMNQLQQIKELRFSSQSISQEVVKTQKSYVEEFNQLGEKVRALGNAAANYSAILAENRKLHNEVQELKGNIRVHCRIRPFLRGQKEKQSVVEYIGENGELIVVNPSKQGKEGRRSFKFNKVYSPAATQAEVYSDIQPLIQSVLDGYNVCIFAYGQTGSGKTYTMTGPDRATEENWGVNYRALNDLFRISQMRGSTFTYEITVQMMEIYNEQTSDVLDLMDIGLRNRAKGSTAMNERSSRSHSVVTIHVHGVDIKSGSSMRSSLHLVDLAGSERVDRSEVTGDRLKEAQHINKSLSALGDLTQLLQTSLGGQAKTLMFVQLNPEVGSYSETTGTLKFAERASGVELGAARSSKEGRDVRDLMEQVVSLKDAISQKDDEFEKLQLSKDKKNVCTGVDNETHSTD